MTNHAGALAGAVVVLVAYWTVLVAEIIGDKSIYTVASLGLRFPTSLVFGGMTAAFAGKMLVAVWLGHEISRIPGQKLGLLSAAAFFASALFIWLRGPEEVRQRPRASGRSWRTLAVCFSSLFFTEWGDPGQIAAAALTLQTRSAWAPWLGGTLALLTKGSLALMLGYGLRDRLPLGALRLIAAATCCLLGILALTGSLFR